MKTIFTLALFAAISTSALATKPKPVPTPTPAAGSSAVSAAQATAIAAAVALAVQQQTQVQGQQALGGNAHSTSGGNTLAANTALTVEAAEGNTPPVVAGVLPSVPTSCRLYLFGGVSSKDGAGSGSIPIGNDQTCLSIAKVNLMERTGGFTQTEKQAVVCKVEGMAELPTCKNLNKPAQPVSAVKTADYTGDDPIVRARLGIGE